MSIAPWACRKCLGDHNPFDPCPTTKPTSSAEVIACERCDVPGGAKTYANQACLPLNGRVVCIDWCIHHIVAALNAAGIETGASCCGHGTMDGVITLKDGRELRVVRARSYGTRSKALPEFDPVALSGDQKLQIGPLDV